MKGGGAAGLATLGAAGFEVAQCVLAEMRTAILSLVSYLDTLRCVFFAVTLGGVAVSPFVRTALRYGAIVLTAFSFLLAV